MNLALQAYIKKIGSQQKFAELCGVSQQLVSVWLHSSITPKHALHIEKVTKKSLKKEQLCPEIFSKK